MKYSLQYINKKKFDVNRNRERRLSETFIPINWIGKKISSYPAYILLNLGIHPDYVTFAGILFVLTGSFFMISGNAWLGIIFWLLFCLSDSVDGDMARCAGPTSYGAIIDSFGADFFYAFTPISVGYYLYSTKQSLYYLIPDYYLLIGALVSVTFLTYRLINSKLYHFSNKAESGRKYGEVMLKTNNQSILIKIIKIYRHTLIKGNFFSEPGMITWFTLFVIFKAYNLLGAYLFLILIYNTGYLLVNFLSAYKYFINYEIGKSLDKS